MRRPLFNQVTIIGLGLMGGSIGMALRRRQVARRVVGVDRTDRILRKAKARGAIDFGTTRLSAAVADTNLVVIATPPSSVVPIAASRPAWMIAIRWQCSASSR